MSAASRLSIVLAGLLVNSSAFYSGPFPRSNETPRLWQRMKQDSRPIAYRIFMYGLAYGGETEPFDPPKTYYDGFLKEGAVRCQPYKNINF